MIWTRRWPSIETALVSQRKESLGKNLRMELEQAQQAGAKIIKTAQVTFYGGYAGYFQYPDTHVWEIAWNPQLFLE